MCVLPSFCLLHSLPQMLLNRQQPLHRHRPPAEDPEAASARLIAELLQEDLTSLTSFQDAQRFQLATALSDSRPGSPNGGLLDLSQVEEEDDHAVAIRQQLDAVRFSLTATSLSKLDAGGAANLLQARRLAVEFEAQERKEKLDWEFARALQRTDDEGRDSDLAAMQGVERVLGEQRVKDLMVRI